jgi:glutamyl-tRNA synthetase
LALGLSGARLAKRDGAVTLSRMVRAGIVPGQALSIIATSLGLAAPGEPVSVEALATRFDPARLPREPWVVRPEEWSTPPPDLGRQRAFQGGA